ncbi:hypothetical protein [Nesterenkonia sp. AN1]|uniref:hypothetical protein n=1 Tax=Nesterenkonia sp. AN1 TaxID=652017 RepID=UPI0004B88C0D|nr:hypothetical protein [Nesterenkonia sp. AN1]
MPESAKPFHIRLLADPGLPTRRVNSIQEDFAAEARKLLNGEVTVSSDTRMLRIRPDATLDIDAVREMEEDHAEADAVIMLTEIPRHSTGHPLISEIFPDHNVAIVSCPTLGAWATKSRIRKVFTGSLLRLLPSGAGRDPEEYDQRWSQWKSTERGEGLGLFAHTITGGPRTVAGMVLGNDPLRAVPKLTSALGAGAATGAFGIFYSSIWQMADALSTTRLVLVGLAAVVTMIFWLVVREGLWDRTKHRSLATVVTLYNGSTAITLLVCILLLYLLLVGVIFLAGLVIIDAEYLATVIGGEVSLLNYLNIAWFSAVMGVFAGAIGSSFDSGADLRRLTHGQRERQREYTESA